jgi:glycosyltransferase involved in cell wall biosynthesis
VRYAIVHPSFAVHGGTEVLLVELIDELVRRGHEVTLFAGHTSGSPALPDLDPRVELVELDTGPVYFDKMSMRDWTRTGADLAPRLLAFDVLCFQGLPSPIWFGAAVEARPALRHVPSTWFCHGLVGWLYDDVAGARAHKALDALGRGADRQGVALAKARLEVMRERGLSWSLGKLARVARAGAGDARPDFIRAEKAAVALFTRVLANSAFTAANVAHIYGVEAEVCYPGLAPAQIPPVVEGIGRDMLTVARLQFSKNHRGMLRAVAELRRRGTLPFRRHVIVGDGAELSDLRSYSDELGVADVVEFAGSVTGRALDAYYRGCGLFALPAFDEGFGLVYLEAAARARASLAPDHGGPAEIVIDGETGWTVDPFDTSRLADVILEAFSDAPSLQRRGVAARARLEAHFTLRHFADRFEALTAELVPSDAAREQPG